VTTAAEAANPPDAYRRRYWCLAVTCIALTVIGCALTILNVAIPALNRELGADAEDLHFWWGSVLLVNLPVVLVMIVATLVIVPESRDPENTAFDVLGAGLSIVMITGLVFAFIEAPGNGLLSGPVLGGFAVALFGGIAFDQPMLDVRLFRRPTFTAPALMLVFGFFVAGGLQFLLPQYLEFVRGDSVFVVGLLLGSISLSWSTFCAIVPRLSARYGERVVIAGGLLVTAAGSALLLPATTTGSLFWVVAGLLVMSAGMGTAMVPSTTMLVAALPPEKAGVGSAMNDVTREFGTAFGVAVLGSVLTFRYQHEIGDAVDVLPAGEQSTAQNNVGDAVSSAEKLGGSAGSQLMDSAHAAFTSGLRAAVIAGIVVLVLTATAILVMLPHARHVRRWHRTGILGRPHHQPAPALVGGSYER
jgi:MFS transporter, DHA2 family, multidrug resistance protein